MRDAPRRGKISHRYHRQLPPSDAAYCAMHRFYYPGRLDGPEVEMAEPELSHMVRALRIGHGEDVVLFDGAGAAAIAQVISVSKRVARLSLRQILPKSPCRRPSLTLAVTTPKADRFRWLVEKATELGVDRLIPLTTERSIVSPGDGKLKKMRQVTIAACKQCGRNDLMDIAGTISWSDLTQNHIDQSDLAVLADPDGSPIAQHRAEFTAADSVLFIIGPEGGLCPRERDEAVSRGVQTATLGDKLLRVETAALACAAFVRLSVPVSR